VASRSGRRGRGPAGGERIERRYAVAAAPHDAARILQNILQNSDRMTKSPAFLCIAVQCVSVYDSYWKPRERRGFRGFLAKSFWPMAF
jgi:hypothetical protein